MQPLLHSLYAYNDWANGKIVALCDGLTDEQLDQPRAIGFGTLRATLFHILNADLVWMERWRRLPWRPFPKDPAGMSLSAMAESLCQVSDQRTQLIDEHSHNDWSEIIEYQDSQQTPYKHRLHDLLLHVFFHGVHHRAQALSYLKSFGRTIPGGIDYIFYRLAKGSVKQSAAAVDALNQFGLGVNESLGADVQWQPTTIKRMFQYTDWATEKVLDKASGLDDQSLDFAHDIGPGSIRRTLLHMMNVEQFWVTNWTTGSGPFPKSSETTSIAEIQNRWKENASARNDYLSGVDAAESQREIEVSIGGPPTKFKVGETAVQLTAHGTHHRAQIVNTLRRVEHPIDNIDLLYALSELPGMDD